MTLEVAIATIMRREGGSGLQTHFQQFANYLREEQIPAVLITPFEAPKAIVYPTFAIRKVLGQLNGPLNVWWYTHWHVTFLRHALAKYLSDGRARVVYAQNPPSAWAALKARKTKSQRVVMTVHYNVSEATEWADKGLISSNGFMHRTIQAREAEVLRQVDGIVYVSEFMQRIVQEKTPGIERTPHKVIPNFIADPSDKVIAESPTIDLINVGTFEPRKNQSFILDVLAAARECGRYLTATLVGDGPNRKDIEAKARRLGLVNQVRFLGYIPNAANQMYGHRVYIHAARIENSPLVLVEAMAKGLPIFAPPVGGIPEVFRDGVEGQYLMLDNARESADRILKVLAAPALLSAMGAASRARFLECFETKAVAPKLLNFFRSITNET